MQRPENRNSVHVERKSKSDTSNNKCNWIQLKISQKIPEQQKRKVQNQETNNAHILWQVLT
jgi:hypothetical protein